VFGRSGERALHTNSSAVDGNDLDAVETDGVGSIGRASVEDASPRIVGVPAWVNREDVSARQVEPGQHQKIVSGGETGQPWGVVGIDVEPGLR
jgi:hypothetical protein